MDLLKQTKDICQKFDIKPARSKGQNFLIKEEIYDRIVAAANLTKDDTVMEIGPGLGFLTAKLARAAGRVVAVELDDKLAAFVRAGVEAGGLDNVEVANENVLDLRMPSPQPSPAPGGAGERAVLSGKYKIVANLPYNITSVFLRKFLSEAENKPEMMVLMLQKEVAERICAKPGDMSLLAISVQLYADPEIIEYVPKNAFWPAPEVDSAVVKMVLRTLTPDPSPAAELRERGVEEKQFFQLVKIGFSAKRKMLKNNLAAGFRIGQKEAEERVVRAGFGPKVRAEDLGVDDWQKLLGEFRDIML